MEGSWWEAEIFEKSCDCLIAFMEKNDELPDDSVKCLPGVNKDRGKGIRSRARVCFRIAKTIRLALQPQ